MEFVLVNGRTPRPQSSCVLCCEPIGDSYLREIGTRLSYCNHDCYVDHCSDAVLALENRAQGIVWTARRSVRVTARPMRQDLVERARMFEERAQRASDPISRQHYREMAAHYRSLAVEHQETRATRERSKYRRHVSPNQKLGDRSGPSSGASFIFVTKIIVRAQSCGRTTARSCETQSIYITDG